MKDRVPTYPGRVKLVPVSGQANTYDMVRADEPVVEGTLLNKATLLSDETAAARGLDLDSATVNEAIAATGVVEVNISNADLLRASLSAMGVGRSMLAAATDGNGSILLGGGDGIELYAAVDKYTALGAHSTLADLSRARCRLAAAADGAGNVLFGGGFNYSNSASYNEVDKYDKSGTRTTYPALTNKSDGAGAATDGNGNVLFGGGAQSSSKNNSTVDKFSTSGTKTAMPDLDTARSDPAAATDGAGNVIFAGGKYKNVVDRYTPSGGHTVLTALSFSPGFPKACQDGNGNVLVIAQEGVNRYDRYGTRTILSSTLSVARQYFAVTKDAMGNVLAGGGSSSSTRSAVVDRFDVTGTRTTVTSLSAARDNLVAATDGNGNAVFAGGYSPNTYHTTAEKLYYAKSISIPAYCRYKFEEHSSFQAISSTARTITIKGPNHGYILFGGQIVL